MEIIEPPKSSLTMELELDRISNLPCNVIDQILSHLPIRDAVRTSVLSSKWTNHWARFPNLVIDGQCGSTLNPTTIANIVDHVLLGHIGPIHKFKLSYYQELLATRDVDRWILHLSRKSIKEFTLAMRGGPRYKMPRCLFSCQGLICLELYNCLLKPPSTFKGFRSLKSLRIEKVILAQDVFENLIVCCPQLEKLTLIMCKGFIHLKIDAPNLKSLSVVGGNYEDVYLRNTLNLTYVCINLSGRFVRRWVNVPGSSSNLVKFIDHLLHIRTLKIHGYFTEYLAVGGSPPVKLPKPCLYLNYLSIAICFNNLEVMLKALCLLRSSPALQQLQIVAYPKTTTDEAVAGEVNSWLDNNPNCQLSQLRRVDIWNFSGAKAELDFIEFLLLSSPMLERMTVKPASDNGSLEPLKKMIQFRRSSVHAKIFYLDH